MKVNVNNMGRGRQHHRGSVYLLVIATGVALTSLGIAGLMLVRAQRAATARSDGAQRARIASQSALEVGVSVVAADLSGASWRTGSPSSVLFSAMTIGDATCSATVSNPSGGNLSDSNAGPFRVTATANVAGARQSVAAEFVPSATAYPVMQRAIWSAGTMNLMGTLYADASVGSNTSVVASGATVYPAVAGPSVTGSTYKSTTTIIAAQTMPDPSVIDMWAANATPIAYASLSNGTMQDIVLSGGNNPYSSSVNSAGLYVIDCGGQKITIQNCRINATLIILNPKSDSQITKSVLMEPYYRNYPVLLVKGVMTIAMDSTDLSESAEQTNFNPSTAPYRGVSDSDQTDTYPSQIYGLTYVSGDLTIQTNSTFEGLVLVGGAVTAQNTTTIRSHPPDVPIAGFSQVNGFKLRSSTFARQVD
ncbi:MAG: hypothetical protein WC718_18885 [Phycisphaerales bacterium]|jgi:hypothetical protein